MANNSSPVSLIQPKTYAEANDQFLAWSPATGNDVIVPVQNLFSVVPLVVGTTITVGNSSGVVINSTAISVNGAIFAGGGGYAGGNLIPTIDDAALLGNVSNRFETLNLSRTITIGNSGNQSTVNTTAFSGTANNALFVGATPAANVVSNAQLHTALGDYQPTVTLGAAVASLAANSAQFIGSLPAASVANNIAPAFLTSIEVGNAGNNIFANSTVLTVGNNTIHASVNSSAFSGTANNVLFVGAISAANVVSNAALQANIAGLQSVAGLAANVATMTANAAGFIGTLAAASVANTSTPTFTASVNVGSNVTVNTSTLVIGSTTLNTNQLLVGNVAVNHIIANGGIGTSGQALLSGAAGNVYWGTVSGNGSGGQGGPFGPTTSIAFNDAGTENGDANLVWNKAIAVLGVSNAIITGNSSVFSTINSTAFSGTVASALNANTALFANNATNLGGISASGFANNSAPLITTSVTVGNATSNSTVNSTSFSGVSNNTLFVGATSAANVVSNAALQSNLSAYQTTAGLTTVVAGLTANNTSFVGLTSAANVVSNAALQANLVGLQTIAGLPSNVASLTVNNALFLGGVAAAGYVNNSIAAFTTSTTVGGTANGVVANTTTVRVGNVTVFSTTNSTAFSATANNTLFVGATSAANVVSNASLAANLVNYATLAGLAANVVLLGANNAAFLGGLAAASYANNSAPVITTSVLVGASGLANNVTINATAVVVGNVTVFSVMTPTSFSGTSNNALNIGGLAAASVANNSAPVLSVSANVGANVSLNTTGLTVVNGVVNSIMTASLLKAGGQISANGSVGSAGMVLTSGDTTTNAYWSPVAFSSGSNSQIIFNNNGTDSGDANLTWNTAGAILSIGTALQNTQITSTSFSGQANDSLGLGGLAASNYANTTKPVIANTIQVGAGFSNGVIINTTAVFMGNSTVFGTVNTTNYTGTANNATNLNGLAASNYANNSAPVIAALTANVVTVGNSISNASINSTSIAIANVVLGTRITANGSVGVSGQVLTSGGVGANDYWVTLPAGVAGTNTQITFNASGVGAGDANLTWNTVTATMRVGNSTVFDTINSTSFSGTANNALSLGGLAAANYPNTSIATFSASVNVGSSQLTPTALSVAGLTSNSTAMSIPGAVSANGSFGTPSYVLTSAGSGANAYWAIGSGGGGGTPGGGNNQIQFNSVGTFAGDANLTWNASVATLAVGNSSSNLSITQAGIVLGNTTTNTTINSTGVSVNTGGTAATLVLIANVVVSGVVNTTQNTVISGANLVMSYFNGNSTVNTTSTLSLNASTLFLGNSVSNTVINSTSFAQVQAVNGYSYLPGGLLMQWGLCPANTTSQTFTWPKAFVSNAFNIQLTAIQPSGLLNITENVNAWTKTGFSGNTSANANVFFTAIGF